MKRLILRWQQTSLLKRIALGAVLGLILGFTWPSARAIGFLGEFFIQALKAIAPILIFILVANSLAQTREGQKTNMKTIIILYLVGTFAAALSAVAANYLFPVTLLLPEGTSLTATAPDGIGAVMKELLLRLVENPIQALANANFIGVLTWAVIFGLALKASSKETKHLIQSLSEVTSQVVRWLIELAPFGIIGLVFSAFAASGIQVFTKYGQLALVLVGTMAFVAFVINPLIAGFLMRKNPFPLILRCLKESGIPAFFTRSSAANIPVNMKLCKDLGLDEQTYSVSIPLGATINMAGAAITINTLTLAATNTLGISVDFWTAVLLSLVASISACGASGITGGSLMLVPVACSLFGIPNDISMSVVAVGYVISIIQDSCETGLNSSTDVLFTAVAEWSVYANKKMSKG